MTEAGERVVGEVYGYNSIKKSVFLEEYLYIVLQVHRSSHIDENWSE